MTTTDHDPLAEQIAREHKDLRYGCKCGVEYDDTHAAHIATVTEQAVRERVAEAIELYTDATWDLIESPNAARLAFEEVAHIARGATP